MSDDCTLIRSIQQGDERAWSSLYARYQPRLWGYFRTLVQGDPTVDLADLCQDTWEQVARALPSYDPYLAGDAVLFPWLAQTAFHRWRDYKRLMLRRVQVVFGDIEQGYCEDVESTALSRAFVMALVERLDADDRRLIELRVWCDLTFPEIAEALGRTYASIRTQWGEIRRELSAYLHNVAPPPRNPGKRIMSAAQIEEAKRRYVAGEMNVEALAEVYGVAPQTMQRYVHGAKCIVCECCGQEAAPARVNSSICGRCRDTHDAAGLRWCHAGRHTQPQSLFHPKGGPCKSCRAAHDRARKPQVNAKRRKKICPKSPYSGPSASPPRP